MTLTSIQNLVLKTLARNRDDQSYFAGGAALNRDRARISDDLDIFHDAPDNVLARADRDMKALRDAGFSVEEIVRSVDTVEAIVRQYGFETQVQWMDETQQRFFQLVRDERFGMRLHDADLAVNKVLCAATRRKPRDIVDLVEIAQGYCALGPLVWAASAKKKELGPGRLIEEIWTRAQEYSPEQLSTVRMSGGSEIDPQRVRTVLREQLDRAEQYVSEKAPVDQLGALFVDHDERPVEADEEMLARGEARAITCAPRGNIVATVQS